MRLPGIYVSHAPLNPSSGDGAAHLGSCSSTAPNIRAKTPTRGAASKKGQQDELKRPDGHGSVERFNHEERRHLLLANRIGPKFVRHLELAGFSSISAMREIGVHEVLQRVANVVGVPVRSNSSQALARVISIASKEASNRANCHLF